MKLYAVTQGVYSDHRVIGIVDDKDDAAKNLEGMDDIGFQEFEVNALKSLPAGYKAYEVKMYIDNGEVSYVDPVCSIAEYLFPDDWNANWENELEIQRVVAATSEEHAVKIVNEMRAQLKACTSWYSRETKNVQSS